MFAFDWFNIVSRAKEIKHHKALTVGHAQCAILGFFFIMIFTAATINWEINITFLKLEFLHKPDPVSKVKTK